MAYLRSFIEDYIRYENLVDLSRDSPLTKNQEYLAAQEMNRLRIQLRKSEFYQLTKLASQLRDLRTFELRIGDLMNSLSNNKKNGSSLFSVSGLES